MAARAGHVDYQVPEAALRKWATQCLTCTAPGEDRRRYRFEYVGSTCENGGAPYTAHLEVLLRDDARGPVITDGLIHFSEEDLPAARQMCAYRERGEALFAELQQAPDFCGAALADVLNTAVPTNPAGCFCTRPMVAHKWRLALATVHYALTHGC